MPRSAARAAAGGGKRMVAGSGQKARTLNRKVPVKLNYWLYLPEGYGSSSSQRWPLILFLHGAGERGSDIQLVKVHGIPKIVAGRKDFPFIAVSPQCPADRGWEAFELRVLLEEIQEKYRVDSDRIYLTGLSMGGYGTWDMALRYPRLFAAIVPICGGGNPNWVWRIRHIPVWVFHGDADPAVPVRHSDEMVAALKKQRAEVKYTRYKGVGHDSWTRTYENPRLYEWLLAHKRAEPPNQTSRPGRSRRPSDAAAGMASRRGR